MFIDDLIEKAKNIMPVITSNEEEKELKAIFNENDMALPATFDFSTYFKLLPLTYAAAQIEGNFPDQTKKMKQSRLDAAKLTLAFGNFDQSIQYLRDYQKQNPKTINPVYDACKFDLPKSDSNVELWQKIIINQKPNNPNDLIFRVYSLADKIENIIKNNHEKLIDEIKKNVIKEFEMRFSQEYDKFSSSIDAWVERELTEKHKRIEKEIEYEFNSYLKSSMNLSREEKKLTSEQKLLLNDRRKHPSIYDFSVKEKIKKSCNEKYTTQAKINYQNAQVSVSYQRKDYIAEKMSHSHKMISDIISQKISNLFSVDTPLHNLLNYANYVCYKNSEKNLEAAKHFFSLQIREDQFDIYLSIKPQDDAQLVPETTIQGTKVADKYQDYYITKLQSNDPRAALLGKYTSCCQTIGNIDGGKIALHAITDPRSGFYVLRKMKGQLPSDNDDILAQCWAWRSKEGNLVFDSVESQIDFKKKNTMLIHDFYTYLAEDLVRNHEVPCVMVGTNSGLPLGILNASASQPLDYNGKRDSYSQRLVADARFPWMIDIYKNLYPDSAFCEPNFFIEKSSQIDQSNDETQSQWRSLCIHNKKKNLLKYSNNKQDQLTYEKAQELIAQMQKYIDDEHADQINWRDIETLLPEILSLNIRTQSGFTILHAAITARKSDIIKKIIEQSININSSDQHKGAPLHLAIVKRDFDTVKLLIDKDADPNVKNNSGKTALHLAITTKQSNVINYLLSKESTNIFAQDNTGKSVLHLAAAGSRWHLVKTLLKRRADPTVKDEQNSSVLHIAALLAPKDVIEALLKSGADINAQDNYGNTPLYNAISESKVDIVEFLLANKADIKLTNNQKISPLHMAVNMGQLGIVKQLIDTGAEINANNMFNQTALHIAALKNRKDMFKHLVESGADIYAKNNQGKTPVNIAEELNQTEILDYIKNIGSSNLTTMSFFKTANDSVFNDTACHNSLVVGSDVKRPSN